MVKSTIRKKKIFVAGDDDQLFIVEGEIKIF